MANFELSVFIFRRDLRLIDNTGLLRALRESIKVMPVFIFTPKQVSDKNKHKSSNAIQFMVESLTNLDTDIGEHTNGATLVCGYDDEVAFLTKLCKKYPIQAIYVNEDYTPYSILRDRRIEKFCKGKKIAFSQYTDILLVDDVEIRANNGNPYSIFTMYYNKAIQQKIRRPDRKLVGEFFNEKMPAKYQLSTINYTI